MVKVCYFITYHDKIIFFIRQASVGLSLGSIKVGFYKRKNSWITYWRMVIFQYNVVIFFFFFFLHKHTFSIKLLHIFGRNKKKKKKIDSVLDFMLFYTHAHWLHNSLCCELHYCLFLAFSAKNDRLERNQRNDWLCISAARHLLGVMVRW